MEDELKKYVMDKNCDLVCLVFTSMRIMGPISILKERLQTGLKKISHRIHLWKN